MRYVVEPSLKHKSSAVTHVNKNSLLIIFIEWQWFKSRAWQI